MRLEIRNRIENIKNKNIPIGYKKVVRFIIPNVWEFIEIGKIAKQVSDLNNENKNYNVLSCTKYDGLVDSLRYFKKQIFSNDLNKYKKVHYNYFAYATNHIDEGSIGLQELYDVGLVSPMYTVFKTKEVVNKYLYALLKTENYRRIYKTMMSASVDRRGSLRWKGFSKIRIPFPPYHEQQKIAEILSTCDKVIELKEKLIEQKKLQKKYLMQAFLNPKSPNFRRLPGFDKDWEEVELGSLGEFKTSSVDKKDYENQETVELLNYMDVYRNPTIDNSLKLIKVTASIEQIKTFGLGYGDILFTPSSETPDDIGHSAVFKRYKGTVLYSYHLVRMKLIKKMDIDFRGYIFNVNYLLNEFSKRATGATRYTLSLKDFKEVFIKLPKDVKEQAAIAKILSTVDQEVEFLEKELEQQKLKKKALMQLLLTGKVRVNVS